MFASGLNVDASFKGSRHPSELILDYMYGVAAYNFWKTGKGDEAMNNYYKEHYETLPARSPSPPSDNHTDNAPEEQDNPRDLDYSPDSDTSSGSNGPEDAGSPDHPLLTAGLVIWRWQRLQVVIIICVLLWWGWPQRYWHDFNGGNLTDIGTELVPA
jgi:hypothetical protein